jgi:hypothetical protein
MDTVEKDSESGDQGTVLKDNWPVRSDRRAFEHFQEADYGGKEVMLYSGLTKNSGETSKIWGHLAELRKDTEREDDCETQEGVLCCRG